MAALNLCRPLPRRTSGAFRHRSSPTQPTQKAVYWLMRPRVILTSPTCWGMYSHIAGCASSTEHLSRWRKGRETRSKQGPNKRRPKKETLAHWILEVSAQVWEDVTFTLHSVSSLVAARYKTHMTIEKKILLLQNVAVAVCPLLSNYCFGVDYCWFWLSLLDNVL